MRHLIWQITPFRILMICLFVVGYSGQAEEIHITSYNTGLLTTTGFNLVPCTTERTEPQAQRILTNAYSTGGHFAILLQEVWTQYGFDTYTRLAHAKGYSVFPSDYEDVRNNGEMIITNMKVLKHVFDLFPDDDHASRGIRSVLVESDKGPMIISNVHTSYSDSTGILPQHKAQFEMISRFLDKAVRIGYPLVFAGDFNAGPNMNYRSATFDVVKTVWDGMILPVFTSHNMRMVGDEKQVTWSEETNSLVSDPARLIRIWNWYEYGQSGWDERTARIDHIIAPNSMRVLETGRTMLQGEVLPWTCQGRADSNGRTPLSDHYAVYAKFLI